MPAPNDGTNVLPSDNGGRFFWGLWDAVGSVFRAWRGDPDGNAYVALQGMREAVLPGSTAVSTSAVPVPASPLARRKHILVTNLGPHTPALGGSAVTYSSGWKGLAVGQTIGLDLGPGAVLYAICNTGQSATLSTLEMA